MATNQVNEVAGNDNFCFIDIFQLCCCLCFFMLYFQVKEGALFLL